MINPKISIFIPVYNEEDIIRDTIKKIQYTIEILPYDFELFIVDDASTDGTSKIMKEICGDHEHIKYVRFQGTPTRRENLAESFKIAAGEIIIFMDADLSTDLKNLKDLISEILKGSDIVIGSRYVEGAEVKRDVYRLSISMLYNKFVNIFFGTRIKDHECGFKAFKSNVIINLLEDLGYDLSLERGIFWDTEMLIWASMRNYKIKEIPVNWSESPKTALNLRKECRVLPYMLKFKFKLFKIWSTTHKGKYVDQ